MIYATTSDASSVMMSVMGRKNINLPIIPFQNASGTNGARVVSVPDNTGRKTSPVAILAALTIFILALSKIRCVFSITTMASSSTIPSASRNENNTIKLIVMPMIGSESNDTHMESGTDNDTMNALFTPIKHISTSNTTIKPITMVLISSCN